MGYTLYKDFISIDSKQFIGVKNAVYCHFSGPFH